MMKCEESRASVWRFVDGELTEQETTDFRAHVALCHNCRRALRAAQKEDGFYRTSGASLALDEDTSSAVLALLPERRPAAGGPRPKAQAPAPPSRFSPLAVAAAAVVLVGLAAFWIGLTIGKQGAASRLGLSTLERTPISPLAVKAGGAAKVVGHVEWAASSSGPWQPLTANARLLEGSLIRTGSEGSLTIQLADGAKCLLNRSTTLGIANYTKDRTLHLHAGEVFCQVPSGRPGFAVQAGRVRALALGTAFNLRLASNGAATLTVLEGKVRLSNELDSCEVAAGKSTSALAEKPIPGAKQVNVGQAVTWAVALDKEVRLPGRSTGWLAGLVHSSPDGKPLKGMVIRFASAPSSAPADIQTTTDEKGQFQIDDLPPGPYLVTAHGTGYWPRRLAQATVKAGEGTEIEIVAEPKTFSAFMYCRVFTASGQPVEQALVSVREYPKANPVAQAQTDADGKCELGPLSARKYHIEVTSSDKSLSVSQAVNLTPGDGASVHLVVQ